MKKKLTKRIPRNTSALAAKSRNGGFMKHRLEPKKGAKNEQAEILDELDEETNICKYCDGEGYIPASCRCSQPYCSHDMYTKCDKCFGSGEDH